MQITQCMLTALSMNVVMALLGIAKFCCKTACSDLLKAWSPCVF